MFKFLQPADWKAPKGYANGILASGNMVFVAGQIGWDKDCQLANGLLAQTKQALENIVAVLAEAQAEPQHIVRMNWFVVNKQDYLAQSKAIGEVYRKLIGKHYPAMTLVEVKDLLEEGAHVEIEVTAVIP